MTKKTVLEDFGVTKGQLDKLENEAAQGILHGDPREDVLAGRPSLFERIEDQEDVAALRNAIAEDDGVRYTHAQVLDELGL